MESLTAGEWMQVCTDVGGADGATAVTWVRHQRDARQVVAATDEVGEAVADLMYVLGYGPADSAMTTGMVHEIDVDDARDRRRWPLLATELAALGVQRVLAYALGPPDAPIGAVLLHHLASSPQRPTPGGRFSASVTAIAASLATDPGAGTGLLDEVLRTRPATAGVHHGAREVNMALGVLQVRHGVTVEAASALLRGAAYAAGVSSTEQARRVLASTH